MDAAVILDFIILLTSSVLFAINFVYTNLKTEYGEKHISIEKWI